MVQDGQPLHLLLVNLIPSSERVVDGLELEPGFLQGIWLNLVRLADWGPCVMEKNTLDELGALVLILQGKIVAGVGESHPICSGEAQLC